MKTKYDTGQVVTLKMKVTYISIDEKGTVKYELMPIKNDNYEWDGLELTEEELDESNTDK